MTKQTRPLAKWKAHALAVEHPVDQLPVDLAVLVSEAMDVGWFCELNWQPEMNPEGLQLRPGLSSAARANLFDRRIGQEILELSDALQEAQHEFRVLAQGREDPEIDRAQFLLSEMKAVMTFLGYSGEENIDVERLAILKSLYEDAATPADVASALQNFATFVAMYRSEVQGVGGFDILLLSEGLGLAAKLRRRARQANAAPARELWSALQLRNRIASLLLERLGRARAVIRFTFRNHPELIRGLTGQPQPLRGGTPTHSMISELNRARVEGDIEDIAM